MNIYNGNYDNENIEIVTWPESQALSSLAEDWEDHCALIDDEAGIEMFGSSAYAVEIDWYNTVTGLNSRKHNLSKKDVEQILNIASQWDEGMKDYGLMDPADYVMKYY